MKVFFRQNQRACEEKRENIIFLLVFFFQIK